MSYPRQDTTLRKLQDVTSKRLKTQKDAASVKLKRLWMNTRSQLKGAVVAHYHPSTPIFNRTKHALAANVRGIMQQFHAQSVPLVKNAVHDLHHQSTLLHAWMLDQVTPESTKIRLPARNSMREADIITDPDAFENRWSAWLDAYNNALVNNIYMSAINEQPVSDASDKVDQTKAGYPSYDLLSALNRIFEWEAQGAINEGAKDIGDANEDSVQEEVWRTRGDLRVCDDCDANEGQSVEDVGYPPMHPNCVLPGQWVIATDAVSASKAFYEGRAIEITLCNGRRISVTENHPILTIRGWIKASALSEFDHVICSSDSKGIGFSINPTNYQRPTLIEDVFSSLLHASGGSAKHMEVSSEDFHGDGKSIKGDINVIRPNSFLGSSRITASKKRIGKLSFNKRNSVTSQFIGRRASRSFTKTSFSSDNSFVSRICQSPASNRSDALHADEHIVATIPYCHPSRFKSVSQGGACDPYLASQFVQRFSSLITSSQIFNIRNFNFSGHVYDLQCREYSLYICNDIIVKNCHCFTELVPSSFADLLRSGDEVDNDLAAQMEHDGVVPNALVIRNADGDIAAKTIVTFQKWQKGQGMAISGR